MAAIFFTKKPKIKLDLDEICQEYSSHNCVSIDGVGFWTCFHNFKMAAIMSFQVEKCCRLVSEHEASAGRLCSSVH